MSETGPLSSTSSYESVIYTSSGSTTEVRHTSSGYATEVVYTSSGSMTDSEADDQVIEIPMSRLNIVKMKYLNMVPAIIQELGLDKDAPEGREIMVPPHIFDYERTEFEQNPDYVMVKYNIHNPQITTRAFTSTLDPEDYVRPGFTYSDGLNLTDDQIWDLQNLNMLPTIIRNLHLDEEAPDGRVICPPPHKIQIEIVQNPELPNVLDIIGHHFNADEVTVFTSRVDPEEYVKPDRQGHRDGAKWCKAIGWLIGGLAGAAVCAAVVNKIRSGEPLFDSFFEYT